MSADNLLELLFSQSLDGFFFMMLDEPVRWDDSVDKERVLDYVFAHQRITKVNAAMLAQYGATEEQFIGLTPGDLYEHDTAHGRQVWREFFDRGQFHVTTRERRLDGTPIDVEGDYICLYDDSGRIIGHFGIQRDVTEEMRLKAEAAAHAAELERQNVYLREAFDADLHFGEIHGRSPAMQDVFRAVELVAATDSSVLILGETGTGKELIARAIHRSSRRNAAVMVKVNCAALPSTLLESELFGHERGAFTGAVQQRKGRFELAHRGTIFLDEVGELPLEAQAKLLRVLQEQEFERVGGVATVRVDARVIAATNRELADDVEKGTFRSDLFFRLNIFPIRVPPLRDRRDDIPILAHYFLREFSSRMARAVDRFDKDALDQLVGYAWPGNVRELANVLERAVILCQGRVLQGRHLNLPVSTPPRAGDDLVSLEEAERRHILRALEKTRGVLAGPRGAAALLGLNRSTLWSRMRKLGISTRDS